MRKRERAGRRKEEEYWEKETEGEAKDKGNGGRVGIKGLIRVGEMEKEKEEE